jgi:regulator of protease activity HflC (stomatin/prohibitin superfamily)
MNDPAAMTEGVQDTYQLTEVVVPLHDARSAFIHRDAAGRIPLVVIPTRPLRLVNSLTIAGIVLPLVVIFLAIVSIPVWYVVPALVAGVALLVVGFLRSFIVSVPEGVSALLARGGKYKGTIGGGSHIVMPWVAVTHLVSQREVPFEVLVSEAPTRDTVRVRIETLLTFKITEPRDFVFSISTDDFDEVLQASCQEALRSLVRHVTVADLFDLASLEVQSARETIDGDVRSYGVELRKVKIIFAAAPPEFMRTQEGQQLAILQRAEQAEKQALAEVVQTDSDALERKRLLGKIERDREVVRGSHEQAEARRRLHELDAESEELRLSRLEARLQHYPLAAHWEAEVAHLEVARALASNSRAVLQIGSVDDISRLLLMQEIRRDDGGPGAPPRPGSANGADDLSIGSVAPRDDAPADTTDPIDG